VIVKLLSYNVRFGGRGRERLLAEVVAAHAPDLVVFQEATDTRVIDHVAEAAGLPFRAARPAHSIAYASRIPVEQHEWHHPEGARHPFMEIVLEGGARVFGLHLSARFSKWSERRRAREMRALLDGIERHQHGFHVLVGDFNTLAPGELLEVKRMPRWIRALVWLSGRDIQRETIQMLLDDGYADGYRLFHSEQKGHTLPAWDPSVRLDYLFIPRRFSGRLKSCEVLTEPDVVTRASDHLPLLSRIDLPARGEPADASE
jgi:endonuclease/exonuclease/phosphatase family metal-dependent hydrolase